MHDVGKIAIPDAILQNSGKFKTQPKQPGYIRTPYTTVTFTNQVAKRSATRTKRYSSYQRSQERAREYHFTKLEIDGYI